MIAAYNFSPGGSDYDRRKMYDAFTVFDINYWAGERAVFQFKFSYESGHLILCGPTFR